MSYFYETEQDEVIEFGKDNYSVDCPYCGQTDIEHFCITQMPWNVDDELRVECPHCKKNFEIRPKYKFAGFFIWIDDEQMDESR